MPQVSPPRNPSSSSSSAPAPLVAGLTEAGWRVALLEAGPKITPKDFSEHIQPWQTDYLFQNPLIQRERPIQSLCACRDTNYKWFVNDLENPYTQEKPFHWIRQRVLGGRSLSWGRQSYRMSDLDFKAASHDGYGADSAIRTTPSAAPSWIISTRASGTMPTLESKPGPVLPAAPLASTFYANAFGPTATPVVSGSETQSGSLSPLHPPRWRPTYRSDLHNHST